MRSERYLANAEKCQQVADAAYTPGTKRLYGVLASQWRHLAEGADWTDEIGSRPLMEKIRHAHFLRQIDKAEGAIREFGMALKGEPLLTPKEHRQLTDQWQHAFGSAARSFNGAAATKQVRPSMAGTPLTRYPKASQSVRNTARIGYDGSRRARHGMDGPA
jgi:hypothetical protein